ncbi:uncharacterized protein [Macrobrachium rosenbergii]|uniref:uncharacterized protein n=1 Tax=Macrobrachium rosenbergii TaxID=79674 RepID=UPI0034D52064
MHHFHLLKSGRIQLVVKKQYDPANKYWQLLGLFTVHLQRNHGLLLVEQQEKCKSHLISPRHILITNFYILDTDYVNYALMYRCENFLFFRHEYAAILSRTSKLDPSIIKRLQKQVEKFDIKPEDFAPVYFHDCASEEEM